MRGPNLVTPELREAVHNLWKSAKPVPVELFMIALPWLWLIVVVTWGQHWGPNVEPPWPVGDPDLYGWCLGHVPMGLAAGMGLFALVRFLIHRRNGHLLCLAIWSSLLMMIVAPGCNFA